MNVRGLHAPAAIRHRDMLLDYHFPDKMYCSGPRLRRPFGIIITADLARAHNYTSHPGARPRCISHSQIFRTTKCWNLTDISHHTTAVWVSPTATPTCCWGRLITNNKTVILSQADMTVTTRDGIIGTREWAGRLRFIRSTNH